MHGTAEEPWGGEPVHAIDLRVTDEMAADLLERP